MKMKSAHVKIANEKRIQKNTQAEERNVNTSKRMRIKVETERKNKGKRGGREKVRDRQKKLQFYT